MKFPLSTKTVVKAMYLFNAEFLISSQFEYKKARINLSEPLRWVNGK